MAQQDQKGMLLAGTMHIRFQNQDGTWPAAYFDVETDALSISNSVEFMQALSKKRDTYGQPFLSIPIPQPAELAVTFSEVNRQIIAVKLSGALTPVTSTAAQFDDVEIEAVHDGWVPIGHAPIAVDSTFKVTDESAATSYEADKDYILNENVGLPLALPDGAITEGEKLKISGTEGQVVNGARIDGMSQTRAVMQFILDGYNLADGKKLKLSGDQVVIANNDAIDFLSSEIMTAPLTGRLEIPGRNRPPYRLEWL